jgi:ABC-type sugar transport system permease subunit
MVKEARLMEKLDFVIFVVVYMMVIGIVSSVFNPDMYSFDEEDYIQPEMAEQQSQDSNWWDGIVAFVSGAIDVIVGISTFLWAGLTLNIPEVPETIRVVMCSPMWAGMGYVIFTALRGGG